MLKSTGDNAKPYCNVNRSNLIALNTFHVNETNRGTITADKFAVPKYMFLIICRLEMGLKRVWRWKQIFLRMILMSV